MIVFKSNTRTINQPRLNPSQPPTVGRDLCAVLRGFFFFSKIYPSCTTDSVTLLMFQIDIILSVYTLHTHSVDMFIWIGSSSFDYNQKIIKCHIFNFRCRN